MGLPALRLWDIADALAAIGDELAENGGELTPEIEARLAALEGAFEAKAERVALYVRSLEETAKAAANEADRLAALAKSRSGAARRLKEYLLSQMIVSDRLKIETDRVRLRVQQNGRPTIAWTGRTEEIPEPFLRVRRELDGDAAYGAWKVQQSLPEGFVVTLGRHLRIT